MKFYSVNLLDKDINIFTTLNILRDIERTKLKFLFLKIGIPRCNCQFQFPEDKKKNENIPQTLFPSPVPDLHNNFPASFSIETPPFDPLFESRITVTNNGADWKQLSDLSSYFLTCHRGHTLAELGFRSKYRQPCDFRVGWRGQSWEKNEGKRGKGEKREERKKREREEGRQREDERKKERREESQGGRAWIRRHPRWFSARVFDHPRHHLQPANRAPLFFEYKRHPSEGYIFLALEGNPELTSVNFAVTGV